MPINPYGVWTARPVRVSAERAEDDDESPHIHLFYDDGAGGDFDGAKRASINVKSKSAISELVYWHLPDFDHPINDLLPTLEAGYRDVAKTPGGLALDYLRGNLMDFAKGRVLPHDQPGARDDIIDFVMPELQTAIARQATVHIYGEPYTGSNHMQGIHDVHMNQGSAAQFARYNGVWQDGGLLIRYPDENRVAALFLAFASQAIHTDEATGHALPGSRNFAELLGRPNPVEPEPDIPPVEPIEDDRLVIVAALVNPEGPEGQPAHTGQPETVYLLNRAAQGLSLNGWSLLNKRDEAHVLSGDVWIPPGEVRGVTMGAVPLSNKGGLITLLNPAGIKVDGVSYTKAQAQDEGRIVVFR